MSNMIIIYTLAANSGAELQCPCSQNGAEKEEERYQCVWGNHKVCRKWQIPQRSNLFRYACPYHHCTGGCHSSCYFTADKPGVVNMASSICSGAPALIGHSQQGQWLRVMGIIIQQHLEG